MTPREEAKEILCNAIGRQMDTAEKHGAKVGKQIESVGAMLLKKLGKRYKPGSHGMIHQQTRPPAKTGKQTHNLSAAQWEKLMDLLQ